MKEKFNLFLVVVATFFAGLTFIGIAFFLIKQETPPTLTGLSEAIMGTILTVLITFLLLKSQTRTQASIDAKREKEKEIFIEKVKIYTKLIDTLHNIIKDNKLDDNERIDLEGILFKISLISNNTTIKKFVNLITDRIETLSLKTALNIKQEVLIFINALKEELELITEDKEKEDYEGIVNSYIEMQKTQADKKFGELSQDGIAEVEYKFLKEIEKYKKNDAGVTVINKIKEIIKEFSNKKL